jgi:hypothetical protein
VRPEDILFWLQAQPFRPFRLTTVGGRSFEVRHPELLRLLRSSVIYFTPSEIQGVADRAEMIGLLLIEHVEPLDPSAVANEGNGAA